MQERQSERRGSVGDFGGLFSAGAARAAWASSASVGAMKEVVRLSPTASARHSTLARFAGWGCGCVPLSCDQRRSRRYRRSAAKLVSRIYCSGRNSRYFAEMYSDTRLTKTSRSLDAPFHCLSISCSRACKLAVLRLRRGSRFKNPSIAFSAAPIAVGSPFSISASKISQAISQRREVSARLHVRSRLL